MDRSSHTNRSTINSEIKQTWQGSFPYQIKRCLKSGISAQQPRYRGVIESPDPTPAPGASASSSISGSPWAGSAELRTTEHQLSRLVFVLSFWDHLSPGQQIQSIPARPRTRDASPGKAPLCLGTPPGALAFMRALGTQQVTTEGKPNDIKGAES